MITKTDIESALSTDAPTLMLRDKMTSLVDEGCNPADISKGLSVLRDVFRDEHNELAEDLILEMLDFVEGWCAPSMKLTP